MNTRNIQRRIGAPVCDKWSRSSVCFCLQDISANPGQTIGWAEYIACPLNVTIGWATTAHPVHASLHPGGGA